MAKGKKAARSNSRITPPRQIVDAARKAVKNAYAPYSGFCVGAAAQTLDGEVFVGANMENASYGMTMCAEVGALQAASTAGKLGEIVGIVVVGGRRSSRNASVGGPTAPCGRCRQLIAEAADLGGRDIVVWFGSLSGLSFQRMTISKLLPMSFSKANLSR